MHSPGIRKHVEYIKLGFTPINLIRGTKCLVLLPIPLPSQLDISKRIRLNLTLPSLKLVNSISTTTPDPGQSVVSRAQEWERKAPSSVDYCGKITDWGWIRVCQCDGRR